ncbi:hypothetical protein C0992_010599 [Termitomyces sp. T32_za158]|nr:hypothetical protein C0992_010599 [Termitomyces sp. T32_za158]
MLPCQVLLSPRRDPSPQRSSYGEKGKAKETGMPVVDAQAEAVWRHLVAAGQRVPPESVSLADPVAQVVITGLLDEIVMLQQHNDNTIKTFAAALKWRPTSLEHPAEAKCLRVSGALGLPKSSEKDGMGPSLTSTGDVPTLSEVFNELVVVDASLQGLSLSAHAPAPSGGPTTKSDDVDVCTIVFEADVLKGNFVAAVHFEAPLSEYRSVVPPVDTWSEDDVEGRLPTMASLRLEELSNVNDYGEQSEETPSEGETPANCRLQLAWNKKKSACAHEAP